MNTMPSLRSLAPVLAVCLAPAAPHAHAQALPKPTAPAPDAVYFPAPTPEQTETDEYTRYELLDPSTASFKIYYEVTATTAGARVFYNPIRKGSIATDESVLDPSTGKPLVFSVVSGEDVRKDPLMSRASADTDYIRVELARPVPPNGQGRVVIIKTYKDPKSYFTDAHGIVFNRPLGIKRNKVVLPPGYELTACTVPSQILTEKDGRLAIAFMHAGAGEAPLVLHATRDAQTGPAALPHPATSQRSWEAPFSGESERARLAERAHGDRDITYFLQQPETHTFRLYHDYTETRAGTSHYINVVRSGSTATDPSAYSLDTGATFPEKTMTGAEMKAAHIDAGEPLEDTAHAVVITFPPVPTGGSLRLRILESYTAPASYRLDPGTLADHSDAELIFDRSLGRPRNSVVLPTGWYATWSATPTTVTQLPDGRIHLDFWDERPDPVDVLLKARRRTGQTHP